MRTRFLFLGAAAWVAAALQAAATVICQGTIEQPIHPVSRVGGRYLE
jgi:hypothetical protein